MHLALVILLLGSLAFSVTSLEQANGIYASGQRPLGQVTDDVVNAAGHHSRPLGDAPAPLVHTGGNDFYTKQHSKSELLSLHHDLVTIESVTGNELAVGNYLADYLTGRDFTVEKQEVTKDRYNLHAYLGKQRNTTTLVTSHIDTVPPFIDYSVRNGQIWGRGSADAKGSVATQIRAVEELLHADEISSGDVALLFVVGEEVHGDGMHGANDLGLAWTSVIFGEPTELKLATGHKGLFGFKVRATGKAGHSGYPELGVNANSMLIRALAKLDALELPSSERFGNTTLNIGRMEGGVAGNVIPAYAEADVFVRLAAGSPTEAQKIILDALEGTGEEGLKVEFVVKGYSPVPLDSDVKGFDKIVVNYGTDVPYLKGEHKRYLYGPGSILVAHSDHEHVSIEDLEHAVEGYKTLIRKSLGKL
ncbi:MAG: hypothetical protein M1833_005857 [Piccolia ochrophora]|nr:MAG: hypothetical protein M1833_005857 [Piccolia ochrophora]